MCIYIVPCWRCDQGKRSQEESAVVCGEIEARKFAFSKTPCAYVVSQGREDIGFVQSDLPWFVYMVSTKPECHHLTKCNGGLLFPPLYVLIVSQK